jgi:hypothetical protein
VDDHVGVPIGRDIAAGDDGADALRVDPPGPPHIQDHQGRLAVEDGVDKRPAEQPSCLRPDIAAQLDDNAPVAE